MYPPAIDPKLLPLDETIREIFRAFRGFVPEFESFTDLIRMEKELTKMKYEEAVKVLSRYYKRTKWNKGKPPKDFEECEARLRDGEIAWIFWDDDASPKGWWTNADYDFEEIPKKDILHYRKRTYDAMTLKEQKALEILLKGVEQ